MRLIIVEDDLPTAEVVRDSINWDAFSISDIDIAHNVVGAQKLFQEQAPDIVICDIEMPKGSGLELLKWARSNNFRSEFIFLTNHESFEFASTALEYNALSYITKPFSIEKTELAITKAVQKIKHETRLKLFSEYGSYWVESKKRILANFWRDLLFFNIPPEKAAITEEISKRKLYISVEENYRLVLISVIKSNVQGYSLDEQTIEYALKKLASEIILNELDFEHTVYCSTDRNYYVAIIVNSSYSEEDLKAKCSIFIEDSEKYIKCIVACYISNNSSISSLGHNRQRLEEMDENNYMVKSKLYFEEDIEDLNSKNQYTLDIDTLNSMFENREKLKIVNFIKNELEVLVTKDNLDGFTMYSIHQDFMQIVYTFLYKREIQAHKLFSDKVTQKLNIRAVNSIFDMMKWVHFVTVKTIDYAEEVKRSESIVYKAKQYIMEHFMEDITKNDVAARVFLTPDYLAKMFKAETGVTIKDYINHCRIEKAKELLRSNKESISMIASEVGFDNFSYFSTIFKKITGTSPQAFRKLEKT